VGAGVHVVGCAEGSAFVKLFGRLHDEPIRTRRRQAYEKHQWTKSREAARLRCGGLYENLIKTPTLMVTDGTSRDEVDGASKRVMLSPSRTSKHRTQPERAGTDLE
jgi:hypothetical protein